VYLLLQGGDHPGGATVTDLPTIKERLLAALRDQPDLTIIDLGLRTGLRAGEVWVGMSALRQEGRVKQHDRGWRVVDRAE
jgi:hypothetical protein